MHGTDMAQTTGELRSQCGNPFPCSDLICAVDFNILTDRTNVDAELLRLCEHFEAKYEEFVVIHAMLLSLYDMVYD